MGAVENAKRNRENIIKEMMEREGYTRRQAEQAFEVMLRDLDEMEFDQKHRPAEKPQT